MLPWGSLLLLELAPCAMQGRCVRVLNHVNGHRPKLLPAAAGRCGQLHLVPKPSATAIMAFLVSTVPGAVPWPLVQALGSRGSY